MELVDTHCHLISERLRDDLPNILDRADRAGVKKIINVSYDLESSLLVLEQIQTSHMLYGAVGIQPHDALKYTPEIAEQIAKLALTARIVAIGEIGLDAYHTRDTLHTQIQCFEHFLDIACNLNLPVIVHVRETHEETYQRILKYSKLGLSGVIHCFTGTQKEANQFLDCGFFISFAGILTFKNAQNIADVSAFIPLEKILIETDSPYLAPVPMRGKVNEPSYLPNTCHFIAQRRGLSTEDFAAQTYLNSHKLFELKETNKDPAVKPRDDTETQIYTHRK